MDVVRNSEHCSEEKVIKKIGDGILLNRMGNEPSLAEFEICSARPLPS
jgi:hypothetical protein